MEKSKQAVQDFWNAASCGEVYARGEDAKARFEAHARARYALEPFIFDFARFGEAAGKDVLEIGIGMGADHVEWAKGKPRRLIGIDLTPMAAAWTKARLWTYGQKAHVANADGEQLPFRDESFDLVYSWGVLHHSPDTPRAINEVHRVLKPGGTAKIMIYHSRSIVGAMLWFRYALMRGRPWTSFNEIYSKYLESPGTKAFSVTEAHELFGNFSQVRTRIEFSPGDLMIGEAGQRHSGILLTTVRRFWPRRFVRLWRGHGLFLSVVATR